MHIFNLWLGLLHFFIYLKRNEDSKFKLATETRNAVQEAALLIQSAQSLLPAVQFPYCTQREISALLQVSYPDYLKFFENFFQVFTWKTFQVIKYLYTDMQIIDRYEHAKEVYRSFQKRTAALANWLNNVSLYSYKLKKKTRVWKISALTKKERPWKWVFEGYTKIV